MIAPHTSCRYAIVYADAFEPEAQGYVIAAVHALRPEGDVSMMLVSQVSHPASSLAFGQPTLIRVASVVFLAANFKDAATLRTSLREEDRKAERMEAAARARENDRLVDAQRDEYNKDEAIR